MLGYKPERAEEIERLGIERRKKMEDAKNRWFDDFIKVYKFEKFGIF